MVLLICWSALPVMSQSMGLTGKVVEAGSLEPVPFAHVFLKGTQVGTSTNMDGEFSLNIKANTLPSDTLVITSLGFLTQRIKVRNGDEVEVQLVTESRMMDDLVVKAGVNPAYAVMDQIVRRKKQNNPDQLDNYSCEEYAKIRFDLNHLTEKVKNNIILKPFDYIWDNTDTTSDGVSYLPVLLVEKQSEHYYRQSPKKQKSVVLAKNVTGLPGPKILEFVEELYFTPNVYDDFVVILDKNFPSPLNSNYKFHYEYYLDSSMSAVGKEYQLSFQPKQKRELAFVGEMKVDSASYAVKSISLRFDIMANVNFVRSYLVEQQYQNVDGQHWMLTSSYVLGDYTVIENSSDLTGFFGRKNATFSHYVINDAPFKPIYEGVAVVVESDGAMNHDENYWAGIRQDTLNVKEEGIRQMVDQLETDPDFILRKNIALGIATGYVPWNKFEIGDFYTFYSNNYVEDSRLKFGFRTHQNWSFPLSASIYGAYGFRDEKWKYGLQTALRLDKANKMRMGLGVKDDIIQLGRSINALPIDHVLTSFVQIGNSVSRVYEQRYDAYFERVLGTGLIARANYFRVQLSPTDTVSFRERNEGQLIEQSNYTASGIDLTVKFNSQNKDINGDFYSRTDLKKVFRRYPDIALQWQYSGQEFGADVTYHKLTGQMSQYLRTRKWGYFKYAVEAGLTEGSVPYLFMNTPFSNQLVLYDDMAFNLMHYLEYVADRYVTANVQQHFDGLIMDRIPLVNRLKWRSFVFAKGYWGQLSDLNKGDQYLLPSQTSRLTQPYYEVGFGLENIFKIARIDFVWRLNDTTLPDSYNFIVKPSFRFSF
ncbi:DUF5686 and carboxypeptidase regulatory-like domain-containing protein [Reichenbachiella agarivorans]|uniref:DUF5686 and carboxypeptidase regulatory-like domain-containing protein n=1 Tax=Reichenbachiella agarivorans TaxID=2979464 RepID=A0ABY6CR03_9BACT|nr:DUF5686 and carboxypeptidase-like regulatory domain-containing protein [Reichenbachiella agarivorans]UXP32931.1 DUF5686 and carboxypeptidase regulatory-like domain-containing protein [Reichenbachiella agarivorans]